MVCSFCAGFHQITACKSPEIAVLMARVEEAAKSVIPDIDGGRARSTSRTLHLLLQSFSAKEKRAVAVRLGFRAGNTGENHLKDIMTTYFMDWRTGGSTRRVSREDELAEATVLADQLLRFRTMAALDPARIPARDELNARFRQGMTRSVYDLMNELMRQRVEAFWAPVAVKKSYSIVLTQCVPCVPRKRAQVQPIAQECGICLEDVGRKCMVTLNCKHEFCGTCITGTLKSVPNRKVPTCALCRAEMSSFETNSTKTFKQMEKLLNA